MAGTTKSIRAADGSAKKRRSIAKRAIIISLITLAAYVLAFGCCTRVSHADTWNEEPDMFLWISHNESRNTAGYVVFYPLIRLLESTGLFEFVRCLPPNIESKRGRLLILVPLDKLWNW